uniref:Uncharacterized protein n=1 Tax=Ganoderma boninense TaxID=34458 RepID=A0A5K1K7D1_9APHY|nr:Uncharacterized protein [Ganoderma boninense]
MPQAASTPKSTQSPSKLPKPPPTKEQIEQVRDIASQLYYGYNNRPMVGTEARGGWEARFMRKLDSMIKLLVTAKFEELPPFAIGCIWENNRRLRAQEPRFDPERISSAKSPGHPAYWPHAVGRLRYTPAFEGPMSLKLERDIRDNWWSDPVPSATHESAQALNPSAPAFEGEALQPVDDTLAGQAVQGAHSVNKHDKGRSQGGRVDEGESEIEIDDTGLNFAPSKRTRGRRTANLKSTAPLPTDTLAPGPSQTTRGASKTRHGAMGTAESDMEVDREGGSRGIREAMGTSPQPVVESVEARQGERDLHLRSN